MAGLIVGIVAAVIVIVIRFGRVVGEKQPGLAVIVPFVNVFLRW